MKNYNLYKNKYLQLKIGGMMPSSSTLIDSEDPELIDSEDLELIDFKNKLIFLMNFFKTYIKTYIIPYISKNDDKINIKSLIDDNSRLYDIIFICYNFIDKITKIITNDDDITIRNSEFQNFLKNNLKIYSNLDLEINPGNNGWVSLNEITLKYDDITNFLKTDTDFNNLKGFDYSLMIKKKIMIDNNKILFLKRYTTYNFISEFYTFFSILEESTIDYYPKLSEIKNKTINLYNYFIDIFGYNENDEDAEYRLFKKILSFYSDIYKLFLIYDNDNNFYTFINKEINKEISNLLDISLFISLFTKYILNKCNKILINDINFYILAKCVDDNRTFVYIYSENSKKEIFKFYVYSSISEIDTWRLAFKNHGGKLYKGDPDHNFYDYVQQTFISIDLQIFIQQNIERIKDFSPNFLNYHSEYNVMYGDKDNDDIKVKTEIDNYNRQIKKGIFNEMFTNYKCGSSSLETLETLKTQITKFSSDFGDQYSLDQNNITQLHEYDYDFFNLIRIKKTIYRLVLERNKNNSDHKEDNSDNIETVILYYLKLNASSVDSVEDKLLVLNNDNKKSRKKKLIPTLASIQSLITKIQNIYIPLFLTIPTSTINQFGLYDFYIPSGIYICKLFDYSKQCTTEECSDVESSPENTPISFFEYSYIGDRYTDIYPFNHPDFITSSI